MSSTSLTCVHVLQNLIGTCCCPIFICAARMPSTSSSCVRKHCRASLVPTAVLHSHLLNVCCHCRWLHPYMLLVCRLHRRPTFAHVVELCCYPLLSYIPTWCSYTINIANLHLCVAEPHWYLLLCYIHMHCSYAINTANLHSYMLQSLTGAHCYSTFAPAIHLLPLLLATFIRAARLPSTSSTYMDTRCRTSSLGITVLHSYMLRVCRHCRWPYLYTLLVCCQHRRPVWVRGVEPCHSARLSYIPTYCVYGAIAAGYIRTHCSSAIYIVDLWSLAELLWYPLLSYIRTCC